MVTAIVHIEIEVYMHYFCVTGRYHTAFSE